MHWAFIAGANDAEAQIAAVIEAVRRRGLRAKFNLVRYNPRDARHGEEKPEPQALFAQIQAGLGHADSRIVPRVGFDVQASCGMFVG